MLELPAFAKRNHISRRIQYQLLSVCGSGAVQTADFLGFPRRSFRRGFLYGGSPSGRYLAKSAGATRRHLAAPIERAGSTAQIALQREGCQEAPAATIGASPEVRVGRTTQKETATRWQGALRLFARWDCRGKTPVTLKSK